MVTADGLRRDAVRAMVTADGTHAPWLRRYVNTWRPYMQRLQQMGCVETLYVRWLQHSRFTADGTHAPWLRRDVHAW